MNALHFILALAIVTGVMQSTLDKAGVGRVEDTVISSASNVFVALSIPITFVSNLGLIVITIWSFFVLPWLPTLGVIAIAFFGFSFVWGMLLGTWRRGESWLSLVAAGPPLVFVLRLVCTVAVLFLGFSYFHDAP
ncbi:hypothetical protein IGS59_04175 [Janthinobacterium sp. GW460P]|uniref:hypothetical protein n=1 Tax=unclassified Janthinobacterium TaxID=2610881 RepID=UPI000A325363|nr:MULTISPECIES: hypothetical protein [unclassified Janthinobacterium]MCC7701425.1 hypothetical protein [Janthinobacterium sp. GW460P]MCC7706932.1 hypothetical protein [Janthinobacterium sp. GW460W]